MQLRLSVKQTGQIAVKKPSEGFFVRVGDYMVSSTQRKINGMVAPANAPLTTAIKQGNRPLRDRGQLLSSITRRASANQVIIGTNHIAAKTNHFGRTITAKKKWLWIPAGRQTRLMQRRYGFAVSECIRGMRAAGWSLWVQAKKQSSSGVMMAKKGNDSFVLFILKSSVTIPARPFLFTDEQDRKAILGMFYREVIHHERNS